MSNIQQYLLHSEVTIETAGGERLEVYVDEADTLGLYGVQHAIPGLPKVFLPWSNIVRVVVA